MTQPQPAQGQQDMAYCVIPVVGTTLANWRMADPTAAVHITGSSSRLVVRTEAQMTALVASLKPLVEAETKKGEEQKRGRKPRAYRAILEVLEKTVQDGMVLKPLNNKRKTKTPNSPATKKTVAAKDVVVPETMEIPKEMTEHEGYRVLHSTEKAVNLIGDYKNEDDARQEIKKLFKNEGEGVYHILSNKNPLVAVFRQGKKVLTVRYKVPVAPSNEPKVLPSAPVAPSAPASAPTEPTK